MKKRSGWVSNSSSSSFIIVGVMQPHDPNGFVKDAYIEAFNKNEDEFCEEQDLFTAYDDSEVNYIGVDFYDCDFSKPVNQILDEAHQKLKQFFNVEREDVDIHAVSRYDG